MQDGRIILVREKLFKILLGRLLKISEKGTLVGWDQRSNIVLSDCIERRFSLESGAVETPLGVYLVKGDQMYVYYLIICSPLPNLAEKPNRCLVGEVDPEVEDATQWSEIRAEPILPIRYGET